MSPFKIKWQNCRSVLCVLIFCITNKRSYCKDRQSGFLGCSDELHWCDLEPWPSSYSSASWLMLTYFQPLLLYYVIYFMWHIYKPIVPLRIFMIYQIVSAKECKSNEIDHKWYTANDTKVEVRSILISFSLTELYWILGANAIITSLTVINSWWLLRLFYTRNVKE